MQRVEHPPRLINYAIAAENLERKAALFGQIQKDTAAKPEWLGAIHRLIHFENSRLNSIGRECKNLLDKIEKIPTIFSEDEIKTAAQKQFHMASLKTARLVTSILSESQSKAAKKQMEKLLQRIIGLQYRIEAVNGGLDRKDVDLLLIEKLSIAALQWKQQHPLIIKKEITPEEIKKFEDTSTYPEFVQFLLSNPSMQESFFSRTLRDNNDVSPLIEFPATCARLKSAYLASRIGKIAGSYQIRKEEKAEESGLEKVVTLPFVIANKTEQISILDESRVVEFDDRMGARKPYTIKQIFNVFARKNREIGDLEMFKDGIRYWNCHQLGSIDLTCDEWWKQLPIIEEITKEQMEHRIDDSLDPDEWVVFAKSSRTTPDFDLDGRHGYLEVAIPTEQGTYCVYPFGIFPTYFPVGIAELVTFLGMTNRAKISYPDENFFYSHRQQASYPMKLTSDETLIFMKTLQKELIKSRFGHLIFQFGAENCAYWAQIILNSIVAKKHNFFKIDYVKSYPLNPLLKQIFGFFRSLPNFCRNPAIATIDRCFGTARGIWVLENRERVFKTHHTSPVRNEFVIYQPGYLHQQIAEGKIKGHIYLGNC